MPVLVHIGEFAAGLIGNGCHNLCNGGLNPFVQFPVVDADTVFAVRRDNAVRRVEAAVKEAIDLFDSAFVGALFLHHLEQACQIQRDNRNNGACTGYQSLVDGYKRLSF